jgi:hypothetical protein
MDRRSTLKRVAPIGMLLGCLLAGAPVAADMGPLHVRDFTMRADRSELRVGETLHLTIDLQVDDTVTRCSGIVLPDFYGFDSQGDEERNYTRPIGTDCTEILTLSPTFAGWRTLAPATLDAIDANTARPMRYATNTVTIHVLDAPLQTGVIVRNTLVEMLKACIILVLMASIGLGVYWAFRQTLPGFAAVRRLTHPPAPERHEEEVSQKAAPPVDESARWAAVAAALSAKPNRQSIVAVRTILRDRVRARDDEVFGELFARVAPTTDPALLDVLRSVERAAFIDDANLPDAIEDAVRALERLADKPPMLSS